ncbi:hypothetical protein [Paenibacillus sp. L3-i20]|uniref:hypothetical protein n=1 Tax=Paenibacillus sp. L3-i20 TaxID=2905833 RepID=UPI001EDCA271|nr:hypothetical protein [Paenibacillus sp. L3-i20]GKU79331.1 hypothetical protein L3i20_v237280 [Paenibacillus sp. L3-i20]
MNPNGAFAAVKDVLAAYSEDEVKLAVAATIGPAARAIPAEHYRVLAPTILADTVNQLDASVDDILNKGDAREEAYGNKGELLKERYQLENKIKLEESDAIMNGLKPDGKSVEWNSVTYPFSNDMARDAFRRTVSSASRKRLAEVEGELAALEVQVSIARDGWDKAVQASDSVRSKAFVQGRLLQFLAGSN